MSVRPSVSIEQLGSHWTNYHEIWHCSTYWKSVQKIQVSFKSDKNNGLFAQYLAEFSLEWEIFHAKVLQNIKTHHSVSNNFKKKSRLLRNNVEKYGKIKRAQTTI